ncbi:MAG TPA: rRNA methyltransferase [Rhodospirillaceae bacterium]|nr:rRNA methyltransferase [Rhodospirillaceae bacterium]
MPTTKPTIILVDPQMGENIGAAARAMHNFGLDELRLVNPRDGWPSANAITMDAGALERMQPVRVFQTLAEAIADLHFVVATTARPRDMIKPVFTPRGAATEINTHTNNNQKTGIVFGAERMGLINDDIALCHAIATIPCNPDFSSFNLAQAVLLMAYEWMAQNDQTPGHTLNTGDSFPATQDKCEEFLSRLEFELNQRGFFRTEEIRPTMKRNIRNIFVRAGITDQEIRTLHGVVSSLIGK